MTDTKKPAPRQRDGQTSTNRKEKQMLHQNTVLDHLFAELATVSDHYTLVGGRETFNIVAYVTLDHTGPDVQHLNVTNPVSGGEDWTAAFVEVTGRDLALALNDILGMIAAAAPLSQQVSA